MIFRLLFSKSRIFSVKVVLCFGNQFRTNALGFALILVLGAIGKKRKVGPDKYKQERKYVPKLKTIGHIS